MHESQATRSETDGPFERALFWFSGVCAVAIFIFDDSSREGLQVAAFPVVCVCIVLLRFGSLSIRLRHAASVTGLIAIAVLVCGWASGF